MGKTTRYRSQFSPEQGVRQLGNMEHLIKLAIDCNITKDHIKDFSLSKGIEVQEIYNIVSLEIAKRYDSEKMSYDDADCAMNSLYPFWIQDAIDFGDGFEFPEPADSIYIAFDAGEWNRGDGKDPVIEYTNPLIKEILLNA